LAVAGAVAVGLSGLSAREPARPSAAPAPPVAATPRGGPKPQPAAKPARPGRLLVWTETEYVFYTPDGKADGALPGHPDKRIMTRPVISPDGKRVAFLAQNDPPVDEAGFLSQHVFVRAADGTGDGVKVAVKAATVFWSADGKRLVAAEILGAKEPKDVSFA